MGQRPIHPDALPALEKLQGEYRIGVLSNADDRFLDPVVQRLGVPFEAVLSSEAARCYKPHPQLFRQMLGQMDLDPQETVYVGDRQYEDVQGAGEAGMITVWINRDRDFPDPSLPIPDHCIGSLLEIPALFGS
jgi:putative hydrolase of the HAD superfamily